MPSTFRPDMTTIVAVGDVTPEHVRSAIETAFGGWTAQGPPPNVYPPAIPRNRASSATIPATGRIQADVTLAQTLPLTYSDADYPVLQLANAALSGGFGSVLYHDVREVHGYAYSVDSSVAGGHNRSTFTVNYGAYPQNAERAQQLIVRDITALQKTAVGGRPAHSRQGVAARDNCRCAASRSTALPACCSPTR